MTCELCNGTGHSLVLKKHPFTGFAHEVAIWCSCIKSQHISLDPNLKLLQWLGDRYIPIKEVDNNLSVTEDLVIIGTSFESFCLHAKSKIMDARDNQESFAVYAARSINVVFDYYLFDKDNPSPMGIEELSKFDLVILSFDTEQQNKQLKPCLAQALFSRVTYQKPTWIFVPPRKNLTKVADVTDCEKEYSEELSRVLTPDIFKRVTLSEDARKKVFGDKPILAGATSSNLASKATDFKR